MIRELWDARVLPHLVERACRSRVILAERRRWIPEASGHVLEVGVSSGLNLAFYDPARVIELHGIDLSPPMLAVAGTRAAELAIPIQLALGDAEALAFDRARFDSVVMTYTLCSVRDPRCTLAEIHRVLRPGGRLILVEHGRAPDARTQRWQRWLTPAWSRVGGNCHLDRDVVPSLEAAGFSVADVHSAYTEGASWLAYTSAGIARP